MEVTIGSVQDQEGWASKGPDCKWGQKAYSRPPAIVTPSTVQVSPGPHLPWTHLPACREGPGFSGQACLLLGTQLPMLRVGQTSPGPCGRYFYPPLRCLVWLGSVGTAEGQGQSWVVFQRTFMGRGSAFARPTLLLLVPGDQVS